MYTASTPSAVGSTDLQDGPIRRSPARPPGASWPGRVLLSAALLLAMPVYLFAQPVPLFDDSGQSLGGGSTKSLALGDVDGDGDLDAFVGKEAFTANRVWLNDGAASFTDSGQALGAAGSLGVVLADLDGDTDLDAFVANGNGVAGEPNRVWLNDGAGVFSAGQALGNNASFSVALGDVDGDSHLDAVVGNISGHVETIWLGAGDGTFALSGFDFGDLGTVQSVGLSDLDGDGDRDVVFGVFGSGTRMWRNNGDGTFVNSGLSFSGVHNAALGDLDGDSDLDLFIAERSFGTGPGNKVLLNDGAGGYTDSGQSLGSSISYAAALGDVDGDGSLDAFVGNSGANTVWLNDGAGGFTDSGLALGSDTSFVPTLGDLDGDGDLDAFVGNVAADRVWINNSAPPSMPPTAVAGPDQPVRAGDTVQLDGTASFDDNTPSAALGYDWTLLSAPPSSAAFLVGETTATPSFVADVAGTYVVRLVVTDADGLSSDTDEVEISSDNLAPTSDAGADQLVVVDQPAILDGSASSDPEGDPLTFDWSITGAPAGSSALLDTSDPVFPSLTADVEGSYEITLVVSDFLGPGAADIVLLTAVGAAEFAETQIVGADDAAAALDPDLGEVTTQGNQEAFGNFLIQAARAIQEGDTAKAIDKLEKAIGRTDGCVLRGAPDANGMGRDWITDCAAQAAIHDLLTGALDALQPQ